MILKYKNLIVFASALFLASCRQDAKVSHKENETQNQVEKTSVQPLPEKVSFNEHIQPILSEYCYHCHGPDATTRMPEKEPLRLDLEEEAFKMRDAGSPVIIKGKPQESELVRLIRSKEISEVMPPPESHKTMGEREIALLEKWIEQGAEYQKHWSYEPVVRQEAPKNVWSEKPIDGFIYEKLAEVGLKPNPADDVRRFHRRLSFDLTGLPPEPSQTDAFEAAYAKDAELAVSQEADRLLATIQSAEHFARHWLDAARYADTHGIHIDNARNIWPYRDWVVRAFHSNMRWDQFTTEQLAGDLLPNPTLDQQVATGFLRSLATTGEGGAIAEEYEAIYATDRVDAMSGIWLGLTASCASCHDHKFDPFSTKEFYQFTSFFRNNTMTALDDNNANHPPSIFVPIPEDRDEWVKVQNALKDVDGRIAARRQIAVNVDFNNWLLTVGHVSAVETDLTLAIHLPLNELDGTIYGKVDGQATEWPSTASRVDDGTGGKALSVSNMSIPLGEIGNFSRGDQVSFGGFVRIDGDVNATGGSIIAKMDPAQKHRGWDLFLEGGRIGAHLIDEWDKSANRILSNTPLAAGKWHHVMILFNGQQAGHQATSLFIDGKPAASNTYPNTVGGSLGTKVPLRIGSREGGDFKLNGNVSLQDFRFYRKNLTQEEISRLSSSKIIGEISKLPENQRNPEQNAILLDYYMNFVDPPSLALLQEKQAIKAKEAIIRQRGSASLVFQEKAGQAPFAHVLTRGSYTAKGEKVFPATPAMLPPMSEDAPKNRLGLAKWLNDPKNPLPARVTMNRLWINFFGTGIVDSAGDFGIMGSRPSHPKLLDWLASEFIASGWDYRHMAKTIATSKTYRQSGSISSEKLEKDYSNRLISRGPRLRLDAEQLRDLSLASSGLLSLRVGGAPVKPYQPDGIWEAVAMPQSNTKNYQRDKGESLYRRSIYTFWKRSAAPPAMEIFDAPTREVFCLKRERTNTPLQALALMNDPQFVEAGRQLATKVMTEQQNFDERLNIMSLRLLSRRLNDQERAVVKETLDGILAYYTSKPDEAQLALSTGESKAPENLPAPELAAWSLIASQLFNLDETLTR